MSDREHTAKSTSHRTGIFATLGALLCGTGTSAPSRLRATLAVLALAIAALLATAASASATPSVKINPPSDVSYGSAHLSGEVNANGVFTVATFEYCADALDCTNNANWTAVPAGFLFGSTFAPVQADLAGLKGGTKYSIRLHAGGSGGEATSPPPNLSFTTLTADPPAVEQTDNASEVEYTTASVSGKVNRPEKSNDLTCNFEYITDAAYLANPVGDRFSGATPVACEPSPVATVGSSTVTVKLTGLTNATTYHLRLAVSNASAQDAKEAGSTFTTLAVAPPSVVSIESATNVEYTQAHIKGVVERPATSPDPAFDTSCNFEYITDKQFNENPPGEEFAGATPVACEGENPITAAAPPGPTAVEATLTGLAGGTEYHLRLSASNLGGSDAKEAAAPFTTLAVDPPSVLAIDAPGKIDQDSATVSGEIERPANPDPAFDVNCRFQYVTDDQFKATGFENPGEALCEPEGNPGENPIHTAGSSKVTATLFGLTELTTYHLRLAASNPGGTDNKDALATFTTTQNFPASAVCCTITEVSYGGVTLSGEFDPDQSPFSQPVFEVSTDGTNWSIAAQGEPYASVFKLIPIGPLVATGLKGATKYFVRLRVRECQAGECGRGGDLAVSQPPYPSFTTLPVDPATVLKANDATDVTAETAKVSGEIERPANSDAAFDANCRFEYVTEAQFQANGYQGAGQTPCGIDSLTTPEEKKAVEAELTDLKSGTKYHLRLTATNAGPDTSLEAADTFTTVAVPATVANAPGASDGNAGYTLQGIVNPHNSTITSCEFVYGPTSEVDYKKYPFAVPCSPTPGPVSKPVTVEGHVTGLTPDATYHSRLVVTNDFGTVIATDQTFVPTLDAPEPCANETLRKENSSLALPECRAYEMVSPPNKAGLAAEWSGTISADGDSALYVSSDANINGSGQGTAPGNYYVASRTDAGWKTPSNLNGPLGSLFAPPYDLGNGSFAIPAAFSADLKSSILTVARHERDFADKSVYLHNPDGSLTLVGNGNTGPGSFGGIGYLEPSTIVGASADLSHVILKGTSGPDGGGSTPIYGPGVYEFVGTGNAQPRRVDVDNSGNAISTCVLPAPASPVATYNAVSTDGRMIVFNVGGGCGGANPPAPELWARVNGTTSIDVSASQCTRPDCNVPANPTFQGAAKDGSRVYFTTTQQLVNGDTDETNDLYACDIPPGTPAPTGEANSCSSLSQVSAGDASGAEVEGVKAVSKDGSSVYFVAQGVLAANPGANEATAVAGARNFYLWQKDAAHPAGQTTFVGGLDKNDVSGAQITPDDHYMVFTTASQLVETDTDEARDVYRYDAETGQLTRVSINVFGVAGNGEGFDVRLPPKLAVSDDGEAIVFITVEPLSPRDGNDEDDVYLWKAGHVSLISTGSARSGLTGAVIDASGNDVFFDTLQQLAASDGDDAPDIYDARVGGGFSVPQSRSCSGEACQPERVGPPPIPKPETGLPGEGNPKPKHCSKGKVLKHGKCVKKPHKHSGKKHPGKKAGHKQGGGK